MVGFRSLIRFVALSSSVAVASCSVSDSPSVTTTTRDSAGITIVENSSSTGAGLPIWRFVEPPSVEIGVLEGDPAYQLNGVVGAIRLTDGRIVVADGGSREIRFFGESGNHLLTVGGRGEGPGEFARLASIDRLNGDTLVASDWPIGTRSWFDSNGLFLDKTRVGPYWPGLIGHTLVDGSLLVDVYERNSYGNELEWWAARGQEDLFRPSGQILLVSRTGDRADTVRSVIGEEWFKIGKLRQGLTIHALPFARTTKIAWASDNIFVGETGHPAVEVYGLDGRLLRLIRWESSSVPVTARDRSDFKSELLGSLRRPNRRPGFERWLAAVTYPDTKPAFRELATDRAGRLWVASWPKAGTERDNWIVFASDGRMIATVDAPEGLTLMDIGDDYVVSLWKGELGVEYVRVHELVK